MKFSYTEFDSSLSLAMLKEALANQEIKKELAFIATHLRKEILSVLMQQEQLGLTPNLNNFAMQHSSDDKFIGALLPEYSQDYLTQDKEGRTKLLTALDACLENAEKINTTHQFLALMKTIDGVAFMYDVFETEKKNQKHLRCKEYI